MEGDYRYGVQAVHIQPRTDSRQGSSDARLLVWTVRDRERREKENTELRDKQNIFVVGRLSEILTSVIALVSPSSDPCSEVLSESTLKRREMNETNLQRTNSRNLSCLCVLCMSNRQAHTMLKYN